MRVREQLVAEELRPSPPPQQRTSSQQDRQVRPAHAQSLRCPPCRPFGLRLHRPLQLQLQLRILLCEERGSRVSLVRALGALGVV
jgi:hypothetical protein